MSNNQTTLLTILGIFTIIGLNLAAWNYRKSAQTSKADRLERSIGLAIPDDMRAYVGHRLARARRMSLIGLVLGAWAVVPLIWSAAVPATVPVTGAVASEYAPLLLLLGASLGGGAIGTAISSVKWPVRRDAGEVRYARARAVGLVDYIAPLERRGAWVTVALAALIFLASAVFSSTGFPSAVFSSTGFPSADGSLFSPQPLAAAVWLALVVASLGFFEVVGRRIVNRPQPMASAPELVWDDALRSAEVRDLAHAPIILGMYGLFFGGVSLVTNLGTALDTTAASFLLNGSAILGLILLIAIFVYVTAAHPERYFVKRLWPQYVDVGVPSPINSGGETSDSAS